jgi:hypothetical protein
MASKKIIICKICGKEKNHQAKGLCRDCYRHEHYKKNKKNVLFQQKKYREANKEDIAKYQKKYVQIHNEKIKKYKKKYGQIHKEEKKEYDKIYRQEKKDIKNKKRQERLKKDINFKIAFLLRGRLHMALKSEKLKKTYNTKKLLGCSIEFFKQYIENKFQPGMSWQNYGDWHIDHIIPCAHFLLEDPEQQKFCFHFSNMQPLWAKVNLSKGAKIEENDRTTD